jgi:hypothetical protein
MRTDIPKRVFASLKQTWLDYQATVSTYRTSEFCACLLPDCSTEMHDAVHNAEPAIMYNLDIRHLYCIY